LPPIRLRIHHRQLDHQPLPGDLNPSVPLAKVGATTGEKQNPHGAKQFNGREMKEKCLRGDSSGMQ